MTTKKIVGSHGAFTLIELLTVIAIIAILAGLLFPTFQSVMRKSAIAQAKTDIKTIETAIRAYHAQYGKWPNGNGVATDYSYGGLVGYCPNGYLMDTLRSISDGDTTCGNGFFVTNPRKIVFLEVAAKNLDKSSPQNFVDPWGQQYEITIDTGNDNTCSNLANNKPNPPYSPVADHQVVVWSSGPDGQANTTDDIRSWQ